MPSLPQPISLRKMTLAFLIFFCFITSKAQISNDRKEDIAEIFLKLEKEFNSSINPETYIIKIDSLAEIISCKMESCTTIQDTIKIINEELFQGHQLSFNEDCEFISDIFDDHCGNCASFSVYYLSVANRLGVHNLYPVLAPNHVFVRYDNGNTIINIETTREGEKYSDQWYRNYFGVSKKILLSDTYFRNLSDSEFIAVLISNRGNSFMNTGNHQKAVEDFNTALSILPTLAETYFGFAHYYNNNGDKKKAIEQYNKVIQHNPDFVNAYCNRGLLHEEMGVIDSAVLDYNTAIKLKPNFAEAYYNRGIAYTRIENYPQAIFDFTMAVRIKPDYADAFYNRGCARNLSKDYVGAVQDYTHTIELGHANTNTYIYRGDCRNAIGDKKGACEDWKIGFEMGYKSDNKKRILKYCKK